MLAAARQRYPALKVLVLSGFPEERYALPMIRNGANGYPCKDCESDELDPGDPHGGPGAALRRCAPPSCADDLAGVSARAAPREPVGRGAAGLPAAGQGESVSGIADTLNLSVKTVSTYRSRLLEKLEVASNAELAAYALRHGMMVETDGRAAQWHPGVDRVPGRGRV